MERLATRESDEAEIQEVEMLVEVLWLERLFCWRDAGDDIESVEVSMDKGESTVTT